MFGNLFERSLRVASDWISPNLTIMVPFEIGFVLIILEQDLIFLDSRVATPVYDFGWGTSCRELSSNLDC